MHWLNSEAILIKFLLYSKRNFNHIQANIFHIKILIFIISNTYCTEIKKILCILIKKKDRASQLMQEQSEDDEDDDEEDEEDEHDGHEKNKNDENDANEDNET